MRIITSLLAMLLGVIGATIGIMTISGLIVLGFQSGNWINNMSNQLNEIVTNDVVGVEQSIQALRSSPLLEVVDEINTLAATPADQPIDTSVVVAKIEQNIEPSMQELITYFSELEPYLDNLNTIAPMLEPFTDFMPEAWRELLNSEDIGQEVHTRLEQMQSQFNASKLALKNAQYSSELPLEELQVPLSNISSLMQDAETALEQVQEGIQQSGPLVADAGQRIRTFVIIFLAAIILLLWWGTWAQWSLMRSGWRGLQNRY